jgi:hypothetical protein
VNEYTASNGVIVKLDEHNQLVITQPGSYYSTRDDGTTEALREFFRFEEDERFLRWRWPENPEFIVFPSVVFQHPADAAVVQVVNEANGQSRRVRRDDPDRSLYGYFSEAAEAYFDAHPEPKPAWHAAKEGEVWLVEETEAPAIVARADTGHLMFYGTNWQHAVEHARIARRIYPEDDS